MTRHNPRPAATLQLGPTGHQAWPLRAALRILEARAHCHSAPPHPVHQRVPGRGNPLQTIGLDLPLLNLAGPQDWRRCLPWLLAAFRPSDPYPILVLQGPPGSGKSTAALCPLPFSETALLTLAHNHCVLAFDHLAHASNRISRALCRLSTGHGFFYHERYHALEPVPLAVTLPSIPPQCRLPEALSVLMKDRAHWAGAASELLALPHPPDRPLWPSTPSAFSRQGHRDATTSKNAVTPSPRHRLSYPPPLYAHRQVLWGGRPRPQPDPPVGLGLPPNGPPASKNLIPIHIEDEMRRSYLDYAMSVIVGRAGPGRMSGTG